MSDRPEEVTLGENEHIVVNTPEGRVYISTIMGTGVSVYDAPDESPVSLAFMRRKRG